MNEDKEKAMKMAKISIIQGYAARLPMLIVKNVVNSFGEKGWEPIEKAAKEYAGYRAPLLKVLVDDPNNARSLGKLFDFEDGLSGIKGEWKEFGARRAEKTEEKCIPSEVYKEFPDYCLRVLWIIANETVKLINPNAEVIPFNKVKCIVSGEACCEVKIQIAD